MAAADILQITKIAISLQMLNQFLQNFVRWCKIGLLTAATVKKFEFRKSKMVDGRQFENPLNHHISAAAWPILMKFAKMMQIGPLRQGTDSWNFDFLNQDGDGRHL